MQSKCNVQNGILFKNYSKIIIAIAANNSFEQDKFYKYCSKFAEKISELSGNNIFLQKTPDLSTSGYVMCVITESKHT
jgi:hypothetical protein